MTWSWDGMEKVEVIIVINLNSTFALLLQFRGYFDTFLSHFFLLLTTHTWLVLMCPIQCHLTSIVRTRIRRYKWRGSSDLMDVNSASGEPKASFAAYKKGNNSAEKDPLHSAFFFVVIFPWLAWCFPTPRASHQRRRLSYLISFLCVVVVTVCRFHLIFWFMILLTNDTEVTHKHQLPSSSSAWYCPISRVLVHSSSAVLLPLYRWILKALLWAHTYNHPEYPAKCHGDILVGGCYCGA